MFSSHDGFHLAVHVAFSLISSGDPLQWQHQVVRDSLAPEEALIGFMFVRFG